MKLTIPTTIAILTSVATAITSPISLVTTLITKSLPSAKVQPTAKTSLSVIDQRPSHSIAGTKVVIPAASNTAAILSAVSSVTANILPLQSILPAYPNPFGSASPPCPNLEKCNSKPRCLIKALQKTKYERCSAYDMNLQQKDIDSLFKEQNDHYEDLVDSLRAGVDEIFGLSGCEKLDYGCSCYYPAATILYEEASEVIYETCKGDVSPLAKAKKCAISICEIQYILDRLASNREYQR
ncbi:hypothetical protein B0O99DRAFT_683464 [Bisporella sp. PMI_857]|nr:hypothetical protein B0O99DRAFT_683464 [Bisporella sp. PMI_857]